MYAVEIVNKIKSHDPLINNGLSYLIWLYIIHNDDETMLIMENINE